MIIGAVKNIIDTWNWDIINLIASGFIIIGTLFAVCKYRKKRSQTNKIEAHLKTYKKNDEYAYKNITKIAIAVDMNDPMDVFKLCKNSNHLERRKDGEDHRWEPDNSNAEFRYKDK